MAKSDYDPNWNHLWQKIPEYSRKQLGRSNGNMANAIGKSYKI